MRLWHNGPLVLAVHDPLQRFDGKLAKVGLESGPFTPHLFRSLAAMGYPMVCMDARRAADAIKSRRIKRP